MPAKLTLYDVLGLPRNASAQAIKKRFRELVREFHPDVRQDKANAEKHFVEITEAYKTLIDPVKRAAYDGTLVDTTQTVKRPEPVYEPTVRTAARPRPTPAQAAKFIKEAELAFIRRKLVTAESLCLQALRIDQSSARAHAILGDIYRARHKFQHAINEYTYAVQFDPRDTESRKKLEKLIEKTMPIRFSWESPDGRMSQKMIALYIMGWGFFASLLFLIYLYPGAPIPMLRDLRIPLITSWSWNLIAILFGDGMLGGFLLGSSGLIGHPDEELIFEAGSKGLSILPMGFLLLVFGPFFFFGASILYLAFGLIQDAISRPIAIVIGLVMGIALVAGLLYTKNQMSVIILGGNVAYLGALSGWYLGAIVGDRE